MAGIREPLQDDCVAVEFEIQGQVYSLKNTRDIFPIKAEKGVKCPHCHRALRMITVPNEKAKAFQRAFEKQLEPAARVNLLMPVHADIEIFYPSNLQDLDEALVLDLLQSQQVIGNDRQIVSKFVRKRIDKENTRVKIRVEPVVWDRTGKQPEMFSEIPEEELHA